MSVLATARVVLLARVPDALLRGAGPARLVDSVAVAAAVFAAQGDAVPPVVTAGRRVARTWTGRWLAVVATVGARASGELVLPSALRP
jgi:hypothetical protein